ncbi:MAG: RdgB/HAM1 family non-canonical purine NTP pyrophosphatase [Clostridia bacterium]|nr:RdgB/HAM1 family non-canonical purine NTP pyrophosphatase [Clostridia bacterium]
MPAAQTQALSQDKPLRQEKQRQKKLLVATANAHKLQEIRDIFATCGMNHWLLIGLDHYPHYVPPLENGATFAENALIKATAAARMSGLLTLADDSGLMVDALAGAPGVHSARYAADWGADHDDAANRKKLLAALAQTADEQRGAAFICAAALATPAAETASVEGRCEGRIIREERGEGGFGYDSLFFLPGLGQTMAELSAAVKNELSHRGQAMRQIAALLTRA